MDKQGQEYQWLEWAKELQFIAQAGLTYTKDLFDKERFERIREISAEIMSLQSKLPLSEIKDLFCNETGFQTPKLDTRAAIFKDNKILLVEENDGTWSMPGGWVDVMETVKSNTVKEVKEEAGLDVDAVRVIALHDRNLHNQPPYAYNVCKVFVLCKVKGGCFHPNIETVGSGYFSLDELPPLSVDKNSYQQIEMCFIAARKRTGRWSSIKNAEIMKTEYEKCLAGESFIGGKDPKIVETILRTRRLLAQFNATDYADTERKQALLREMFGSLGKGVHVDIDFHCEYGKHIFIGDKVIINMNCTFVDNNRIDIGSNVLIASNVQIYTATHSTKVSERMVQNWSEGEEICRTYALPVKIEDGVWIGGGAILLPGVIIGRNSVIGAGSVVTRSIPANCVAVGNPCRVIKQIESDEKV